MFGRIDVQEQHVRTLEKNQDGFTTFALVASKIIGFITFITKLILGLITTFILGILVKITFGLLLFPLNFIWFIFLYPILGSSWLWLKARYLRPILILPGVLFVRVAEFYVCLMPSMGELEARHIKISLCDCWPVSWQLYQSIRSSPSQT
jgi:hypothetical protein